MHVEIFSEVPGFRRVRPRCFPGRRSDAVHIGRQHPLAQVAEHLVPSRPLTATYLAAGKRRVLCLAVMPGNQRVPGFMDIPNGRQIPAKCTIKFGGNSVGVSNWLLYVPNNTKPMRANNGLWYAGENPYKSTKLLFPLHTLKNPDGKVICAAIDVGMGTYYPGLVEGNRCLMTLVYRNPHHQHVAGNRYVDEFKIYLTHKGPAPIWSPVGTTVPSGAVNFNADGRYASKTYACRIPGNPNIGVIDGGCRISREAKRSPFQVLILAPSDRG